MNRRISILLVLLFEFFCCNAQSADELFNVAGNIKSKYGEQSREYLEALSSAIQQASNEGDIHRAFFFREKHSEITLKLYGSKSLEYAEDCFRLGNTLVRIGDTLMAVQKYSQSLEIFERNIDYQRDVDFVKYYRFALSRLIDIKPENIDSHLSYMWDLANLYLRIGDLESSKACYQTLLTIESKIHGNNSVEYALTLNNLGYICSHLDLYDNAAAFYRSSAEIRKNIFGEDNVVYKQTLHNLKMVFYKQGKVSFEAGDYVGAIDAYLEEKHVIDEYQDTISLLYCYEELSKCYWLLGNFSKAIDYGFDRSLLTIELYGDESIEYANSLIPMLYYFTQIENLDWANEIATIIQNIFYYNNVNSLVFDIYNSELQIKQHTASIETMLSVLNHYIDEKGKQGDSYYALLNNLSILFSENDDYKNAIKYGKECVEGRLQSLGEFHPDYSISLQNLAEIYYLSGLYNDALALYKECYSNEKMRLASFFSEMTSSERTNYWLMVDHTFNRLVDIIEKTECDEELNRMIYDCLLLSKGILLNYDIAVRNVVYGKGDDALISGYELYNRTRSNISLNHSAKYSEQDYYEIFSECNELERLIMRRLKGPLIHYLDSINVSLDDVYGSLGEHDVAIEFCRSLNENNYYAILVEKTNNNPQIIKLNIESLVDSIVSFQYKVYDNPSIYERIWAPIEPFIHEGDNVYFAADGILHQINIENLVNSLGIRACEKYHLHRVSSTGQLFTKQKNIHYSSIALFGGLVYDMDTTALIVQSSSFNNTAILSSRGISEGIINRNGWKYLPSTQEEIDRICDQMNDYSIKYIVFSGTKGTEEAIKSLSGKHIPILHIATHGFFYTDDQSEKKAFFQSLNWGEKNIKDNSMQRSGLIMAGGQNAWLGGSIPANCDDGILLAEEITSMDLSGTDLVVLSACETGLGDIASDGVYGLQRAFKMAGVQTLVMSLWKVDDNATSLMMQTFYEHLLSGMSKREAFNLAQAAVRAKYPEPYYWAGFIMLD